MSLTAVERLWRNSEKEGVLIHTDVVELPKMKANREFKCQCCGRSWPESINSPMIVEEKVANNLNEYYGHIPMVYCHETL